MTKLVMIKLRDIYEKINEIGNIRTLVEDVEDSKAMVKDLMDTLDYDDDYPVRDKRGFNEVKSNTESTLMFKESADLVKRVLANYTPNPVTIDSPKEALDWYDYLKQCSWTAEKDLAETILYNYILENLRN